jgi:hypothetical protein
MAQEVIPWLLTAEVRVPSQFSLCANCGGQSGAGTGFFSEYFGFSLSVTFHHCSILFYILIPFLSEGQKRRSLETFHRAMLFRKAGSIV